MAQPATAVLCLAEEMMDGIEPDQTFDDEIDCDNNIEEPWDDQNKDAGNQRDNRREFGDGYNHDFSSKAGINAKGAKRARPQNHKHSTLKPPSGSSMVG
jgi:hypothetical protein